MQFWKKLTLTNTFKVAAAGEGDFAGRFAYISEIFSAPPVGTIFSQKFLKHSVQRQYKKQYI